MANKPSGENNGSAGPGYGGFGGSAGYSGSGAGGISGGYAGGGYSNGDYAGEPWRPAPGTHHDDRIHDDVGARLAASEDVDASAIEVSVEAGVVTLEGQVETRAMKHTAGAVAELVPGVHRVHNRIHVGKTLMEALKEKLSGD
jgi:hypothetical protein